MGYTKYNSIENSYREKFLEFVRNTSAANDIWFVTEKIHGSNFTVSYYNEKITFGKRSSALGDNESFYNHNSIFTKEVVDRIISNLKAQERIIGLKNTRVTYYGEIFGPGVQNGVNYGEKGFRFFDIYVETEQYNKWVEQCYLQECETEDLKMVPYLGFGSLDEVLEWNCEFDSKILGIINNPAEGIVLKPNKACFLEGSGDRIILKKKHPKFAETAKEVKQSKEKIGLPDSISVYITENRLDNVFSKIEPSFKNFNQIKQEFIKDILDELQKDNIIDDTSMLDKEVSSFIRDILKRKS